MSDAERRRDGRVAEARRANLDRVAGLLFVMVVALATATATLRIADTRAARTRAVTIMPSAQSTELWHQHTITSSGANHGQTAHTMTYAEGQFRVKSTGTDTDGNRREAWTTGRDVRDVDVLVRIDNPSSLGGAFKPQPGIALRFHDDGQGRGRAIVIDANIWTQNFDRLMIGAWSWPGAGPTKVRIKPIAPALRMDERQADITGVLRNAGDPATDVFLVGRSTDLNGPFAFAPGDHVDIRTAVDKTYEHDDAVIEVADPKAGLLTVRHAGARDAKAAATETGTIRYHWDPLQSSTQSLYPRYVRARIVGSTLQVKSWLVDEPEPGWQVSATIPASLGVPSSGKVGLVTNHLWGAGRFLAFGDVTITPLHVP